MVECWYFSGRKVLGLSRNTWLLSWNVRPSCAVFNASWRSVCLSTALVFGLPFTLQHTYNIGLRLKIQASPEWFVRYGRDSIGTARKISPYWPRETMTRHSSNCFSNIVWGQGNAALVTSLPSSCYMTIWKGWASDDPPMNNRYPASFYKCTVSRGCILPNLCPNHYHISES